MSQRGGSVSSQVRYGEKVYSPVIEIGGADILVSFEMMEALRMLEYLKPDGKVIVNDYKIPSAPILSGKVDYPEGILDTLKASAHTTVINAAEIAKEIGNPKTMNIVLLGALIKAMKLSEIDWEKIIRDNVKPAFVELNVKALKAGMDAIN
jgi:indolepyruvate ferredoxin oxidoreductase beta subunit